MSVLIAKNSTSVSVDVQIVDDSGLAVTGLDYTTAPTITWSLGGANADVGITLATLATITTAWYSGGFKERGGGYYRLDLPDALLTSLGTGRLRAEASGKHLIAPPIQVVAFDPANGANLALTCLPSANPSVLGGLVTASNNSNYVKGVGDNVNASVIGWNSNGVGVAMANCRIFNVTGTFSPSITNQRFSAWYSTPIFNDQFTYYNFGNWFVWWDATNSLWTMSTGIGARGTNYWTSPTLVGAWSAGGGATGSPVFTSMGDPVDANFSNAKYDSSGNALASVQGFAAGLCDANGYLNANVKDYAGYTAAVGTVSHLPKVDVEYWLDAVAAALPNNFALMSLDASGRMLLQPSQPGVTIPNVTTVTTVNIANVGATSSAMNQISGAFNQTTGSVTSGTYANTATADGTAHVTADAAGTLDEYYDFTIGTAGQVGTSFLFQGYLSGVANTVKVFAYNWTATAWDQVGTIPGQAGTTSVQAEFDLVNSHTDSAGTGKVRIRFQNTGLTSASLNADRLLVGYTQLPQYPANFLLMGIDGSGRVNLQPDQSGVTVGTTNSVTAAVNTNPNTTETQIKAKTDLIGTNGMDSANAIAAQNTVATLGGTFSGLLTLADLPLNKS